MKKSLKKIVALVLCVMLFASLASQAFAYNDAITKAFATTKALFDANAKQYVAKYQEQANAKAAATAKAWKDAMDEKWAEVSDPDTGLVATAWAQAQAKEAELELAAALSIADFWDTVSAGFAANLEALNPAPQS